MKRTEFRIRDPYILLHNGEYYVYGTTRLGENSTCYSNRGFDVYISSDLENFSGPHPVFEADEDFFGKSDYWAAEVHEYRGKFYMLATCRGDSGLHGVSILKSDSPRGPFKPHSNTPITPLEWSALDGTLYVDRSGKPYMVFCHEWWSIGGECDGTMCYAELSEDLTHFVTDPQTMFNAKASPYVRVTSRGYGYITDGPCMYRTREGELLMLWSSKGETGYMECVYRSDNGEIDGIFTPQQLLYTADGGHGMLFRDKSGDLRFTLHSPNTTGEERMAIHRAEDIGNTVILVD